jgi:hypothetical protein
MRRRRRAPRDLIHLPLPLDATPPDPAAVNAIDGFDALPRSIRDVLNYHSVNMLSSVKPTLCSTYRRVGTRRG